VPPLPDFDIDKLAPGTLLTATEVAAMLRRSLACLENWRLLHPEHPLRWRRLAGRVVYEVRAVRAFLQDEELPAERLRPEQTSRRPGHPRKLLAHDSPRAVPARVKQPEKRHPRTKK
jgi:hypothetical protein